MGILQLQGSVPLNEHDLEFVGALADLISVALDRYYKTRKANEFRQRDGEEKADMLNLSKDKVSELENERKLREGFVSLLTHDLKTPLSAALMSAQLITRKSEDSDACRSLATRIINNIKRADQMIENLLDANSIRSGEKLSLKLELFEITELIKLTLDEMATIHGDRFIFKSDQPWPPDPFGRSAKTFPPISAGRRSQKKRQKRLGHRIEFGARGCRGSWRIGNSRKLG